MMVWQGEVDGMVSGGSTPALPPSGRHHTKPPCCRLVSSVFFMCLPDEVVIYGECAINPQPDAFGIEPRVAMISFGTGNSAAGSDVDKVALATRIAREREPGLTIDEPLAVRHRRHRVGRPG
jgi:phosphate acetyltransferase